MDALLEPIQDVLEGQIDFEGQRVTEWLSNFFLVATSTVALFVGYQLQDIYLTLWLGLFGALITILIVVPPWPWYNQYPEPWLPSAKSLAGFPPGGLIIEESRDK